MYWLQYLLKLIPKELHEYYVSMRVSRLRQPEFRERLNSVQHIGG